MPVAPDNLLPQFPDDAPLAELIDDLIERLRRGDAVDVDALTSDHPQYSDRLKELFPTVQALAGLNRTAGSTGHFANGDSARLDPGEPGYPRTLGDYEVLREVGRGGMGIVYEALQISLGRRVALKVLPSASALDPRALARFQRESLAAAQLDHPRIVPVFAVGADASVHFYAMRFIDGQSLAQLIASTVHRDKNRAEYSRQIARLGVQAAEALDYAHLHGILHRDIKPGNLLVDETGDLWITDFGLARIETAENLTYTGDLMGTVRYLSPEQAFGKRGLVDQRTDVYALGATLYELLTLKPAFAADEKAELLRQIATEDPQRLRQVDRALPRDLETIVHKCLEKDPTRRYATARDLASDLQRFLADKPITARPPGAFERLTKWSRRHKPVVYAAATVLVFLGFAGFAIVYERADRAKAATALVSAALQEVHLKRGEARAHPDDLPVWTNAVEAARHAEALSNTGPVSAEVRARVIQVREELEQQEFAIHERLADTARDQRMLAACENARIEWAYLRDGDFDRWGKAAALATAFREYGIDVPTIPVDEAARLIRKRSIRQSLVFALLEWSAALNDESASLRNQLLAVARTAAGDGHSCETAIATALREDDFVGALIKLAGEEVLPRQAFIFVCDLLSDHDKSGRSLDVLIKAQKLYPDDFWTNEILGLKLLNRPVNKPADAMPYLLASVALRPDSPRARGALGKALSGAGKLPESIDAYRAALALRDDFPEAHNELGAALFELGRPEAAVDEFHRALELKPDWADAQSNLGVALNKLGRIDEAIAALRRAVELNPDAAQTRDSLGNALREKGQLEDAIGEHMRALELRPNNATFHNNFGATLFRHERFNEAIAEYRRALELAPGLATAHRNLAESYWQQSRLDDAIVEYRRVVELHPDDFDARRVLGDAFIMVRRFDDAIPEYRRALELKPDRFEPHYGLGIARLSKGEADLAEAEFRHAIDLKPDSADAHAFLGSILVRNGRLNDAIGAFRRAVEAKPDYWTVHRELSLVLRQKGDFAEELEVLKRLAHLSESVQNIGFSTKDMIRETEQRIQLDEKLSNVLDGTESLVNAGDQVALAAFALNHKHRPDLAANWYREAFTKDPSLEHDMRARHRFNAARAAILVAAAVGEEEVADEERAMWLRQAHDWLTADLEAAPPPPDPQKVRGQIAIDVSVQDPLLAGIREPKPLTTLPEKDRLEFEALWREVRELLITVEKAAPRFSLQQVEKKEGPSGK